MLTSSFKYDLPSELIANHPKPDRTGSRLLILPASGQIVHDEFRHCMQYLRPDDLLVFNNTRVMPARLYGRKTTGGAVEIIVERSLGDSRVLAQVRSSKSPKPGTSIYLGDDTEISVVERDGSFFVLTANVPWFELMERMGQMPLPPYIDRPEEPQDKERYQTVYAKEPGAVAAPTAGLHFDNALLENIRLAGIDTAEVTLHVGAGTYQPVRAERVEDHQIHSEWINVSEDVCEKVRVTKNRGGRIIAVGTTAMRSLEAATNNAEGVCQPYTGDTDIFIYPGYGFRSVDMLITNFHLPESSLLMLVSAFSGYQRIRDAYQAAIEQKYRFFSYGDAMLIERNPAAVEDLPR